jgi:hypothetical protein
VRILLSQKAHAVAEIDIKKCTSESDRNGTAGCARRCLSETSVERMRFW